MFGTNQRQRIVWLSIGVLVGLVVGGIWPQSPAHAVATAQQESFALCTAFVDDEGEGVFCLDSLTGELKGALLSSVNGQFAFQFQANVGAYLKVDATKGAKYVMVSGSANFRRGVGNAQFGNSVLYVAELNSGSVVAYGIPWARAARSTGPAPAVIPLTPLSAWKFRDVAIRGS